MITIENDNACSLSFLAKKWNNMDFIEKEIISLELDNCLSINDFNFYNNNKIIFYYDFDNDSFSVKFKEKMYIYNKIIIISFINEAKTVQQLDRLFENFISNFYKELFEYKDNKLEILFNNCYPIEIAFHSKISNDDEIIEKIRREINYSSILSGSLYFKDINIVNYLDILLTEYPEIKSELTDLEVAKIRIYNIAIQNLGNDNEIKYPKSFKSDFSISFKECKVYVFDNLIYSDYLRKVLLFLINQKLITDVPLSLKIQAKIKRLF